MKKLALCVALNFILFCAFAQQPFVGTWELVSMKGTDSARNKFTIDQTLIREIRVITPTHYILITHRMNADTLAFERAVAGTYKVTGNKLTSQPIYASDESQLKQKGDFTWKAAGGKIILTGTRTYPDGKKYVIDEMVLQRVESPTAYAKNVSIGTWNQLSSGFTFENGLKDYHTYPSTVRFRIITPTHYGQISVRSGSFESAVIGTYTIDGGAMVPSFDYASFKINPSDNSKHYLDQSVEGDIMLVKGSTISGEGKETFKWEDIFRRVGK